MFSLSLFTKLRLLHTKSNPEHKPTEPQHIAVQSNDCSNGLYETMTETSFQVMREFVYFGLRWSEMTREGFTHTELISPSLSFSLFFCIKWFIIQKVQLQQRKAKSITLTAKCFRTGMQAFINLGMTKHCVWEDQMQNQTIFTHITWIFKERLPF